MDGMLSLGMAERFFGEPQDVLRSELIRRGFVIYEDATLNAGSTDWAFPALFSPAFYDSYYGARLSEVSHLLAESRHPILHGKLSEDGINFIYDIIPDNEMFWAFMSANYETLMMITDTGLRRAPFTLNRLYNLSIPSVATTTIKNYFMIQAGDLIRLFTLVTPFSIYSKQLLALFEQHFDHWLHLPNNDETVEQLTAHTLNTVPERNIYIAFIDSFSVQSPKIIFTDIPFTHHNYWHWAFPWEWSDDSTEVNRERMIEAARDINLPGLYSWSFLAYNNAIAVMLNAIDMVLKQNPNAVIVLQADHGMHSGIHIQHILSDMGYTEAEILELYLSVMSAVRIPAAYGGLDAPLEPRNISRELVNRFVGENYTLLPDRYRD
jgi:hypothetical protein